MSKNRPKIWLNEKEYIYRSEYNTRKWYADRYHTNETEQEIINSCFKYSHYYNDFKKGDIVRVHFNSSSYRAEEYRGTKFEIMRVDYNGNNTPDIILVRPTDRYYQIPVKVSVDKIIRIPSEV